jgi:OPT family oligopeptide transporter
MPQNSPAASTTVAPLRQLTLRAVISGMCIGMLLCISNLYIVLKTGWSIGVTLTASILAWAFFSSAFRLGLTKIPFERLENNAQATVAAAAGYMTAGGNMAALPALMMLTGTKPSAFILVLWFVGISLLGVFAAIPIKRQLINVEALAFPTGTATAKTIEILDSKDSQGATQARYLATAGLIGGLIAFFRDTKGPFMPFNLPKEFSLPLTLQSRPLMDWTLGMEGGVLLLGAGGLMSFRTGWSLLLGALVAFGILAPEMFAQGAIAEVSFKLMTKWTVWLGAAILVFSGLTTFALQWKSIAKALSEMMQIFSRRTGTQSVDSPVDDGEVPQRWFPIGFALVGPLVALLGWYAFDIPLWAGLLALPLSLIMGVVAARVTGETDITPTKALGPVTQLIFAVLLPGQLIPNLMGANITGGVGLHAADLLTVLKSGHLLGARPKAQFFGQMLGIVAGALVLVPIFYLLIPDAKALGSADWPAPSAVVWANVSKALVDGWQSIHVTARWAALGGALVGVALALAEAKAPPRLKKFLPSPSGLGIAMVIPASSSIMMFLGTAAAAWWRSRQGPDGDKATMPISAGFIAGESVIGVAIKILVALGVVGK